MSAQNSTTEEKGITSPQLFASPSSQQSGTLTSEGGSQLSAYSKSKREAESEWVALSLANNGGSNNSSNGGGSGASGDKKKTTMRGWMKIRGVMKQWTIRLFDLRPPYLIYFKDEVDEMREDAVGIIDLKGCKVFERESKKDGFCFKISSLTSSTIYASRGLKNEILATKLAPMNTSIAILRVVTREEGFEWIKAISSAIDYANTQSDKAAAAAAAATVSPQDSSSPAPTDASTSPTGTPRKSKTSTSQKGGPKVSPQKSSSKQQPKKGDKKKSGEKKKDVVLSSSSSSSGGRGGGGGGESTIIPFDKLISFQVLKALVPQPTNYVLEVPREEMKVDAFEQGKSIILQLIKQVKPGMDLTKVTLPTHILEPRSFLEKMTDYFAHVELISQAIHNPDPVMRLLMLTKWYISGFYIMPKTPKKPYNPIIGETFRCKWEHPASAHGPASNSFLICEQVSHHPPVSAIYAGNRADGWVVNGSILFKSKFWGMSAGCLLDGYATMYVPEFGEEYRIGFPSAVAKGFIVGPLTMEMFGEVTIECKATGLVSTIEFKTKPSFRGEFNCVGGSLKRIGSGEVLYEYSGRYDREVFYKDPKSDVKSTLWKVTPGLENTRLPRYTIPFDEQDAFASERLWDKVTKSLIAGDQAAATEEKTRIEELQRQIHRDLEAKGEQWKTKFFDYDAEAKEWVYKWLDKTKLDMKADVGEYDADGRIVPLERSKALKAFEAAPPMLLITESDDDDDDNNDGDVDGDDDEEDDDEEEEGLDNNNNNNNPKTKERLAKLRKQIAANNTKLNGLKAKIRDQEAAIAMLKSGAGCVKTGDDSAKRVSSAYTTVLGLVLLLMVIMFFRK